MITTKEVATLASVSPRTVLQAVKKGWLNPTDKRSNALYFSAESVQRYLYWQNTHDLSAKMKKLFAKFEIVPVRKRGRPYYKDMKNGHILRVVAPNKLKQLYEEPNEKGYLRARMVQEDGTQKKERISRVIMEDEPHAPEQNQVDHLGRKDQNDRKHLQWTTGKENVSRYYRDKEQEATE